MNERNGSVVMKPGSSKDMAIAYVFRSVTQIVLGILVLLGWAIFKLAVEIRDDTRDMKKDWPGMQRDISDLKKQGETFATKAQLEAAEQRVKNEFTDQLKKQSSKKLAYP